MCTKFELMQYIAKPLIGGGIMYFYGVFVESKKISDDSLWYDASLFGVATLSSKILDDLLQNQVDLNQFQAVSMLFEPLVTAFVYTYLYDNVFREKYRQVSNRNWNQNFMLASALNIITKFIENPITQFITGIKKF